jgi:hypothetical protein
MAESKQKQKFEQQWNQIITLTGSSAPEKISKVQSSEVVAMFQEIATEREEQARKSFKVKLAGILEAKFALDKNIARGRRELAEKEEKQYEELNKQLASVTADLEHVKKENTQLVNGAAGNFTQTEEPPTEQGEATEEGK